VLEHGAAAFIYFPPAGDTLSDTTLSRWAQEVVPAVREAIANRKPPMTDKLCQAQRLVHLLAGRRTVTVLPSYPMVAVATTTCSTQ
jgi:hypothetical protein